MIADIIIAIIALALILAIRHFINFSHGDCGCGGGKNCKHIYDKKAKD